MNDSNGYINQQLLLRLLWFVIHRIKLSNLKWYFLKFRINAPQFDAEPSTGYFSTDCDNIPNNPLEESFTLAHSFISVVESRAPLVVLEGWANAAVHRITDRKAEKAGPNQK